MYQACIIGCGAAGMAAAIEYKRNNPEGDICVLEKNETVGKKLLSTGNGRCNATNENCPEHEEVLRFFESIGLYLRKDEEGRYWPASNKAQNLVFAMDRAIRLNDINVIVKCTVKSIEHVADGFKVEADTKSGEKSEILAEKVLIACGGKAAPRFGTTGDGYALAKSLGHTVSKVYPILTPLESTDVKNIAGSRARALVQLCGPEGVIAEESGEVQFTSDGLSGICVLNLSKYIALSEDVKVSDYYLLIDFIPELTAERAVQIMRCGEESLVGAAGAFVTKDIAKYAASRSAGESGDEPLLKIARFLKSAKFTVSGVKGYKQAQCTAGGVVYDEIDASTMESKLCKNLYFAGEVTEYAGSCGGYNLNHAFFTGMKAGRAMAKRAERHLG